MTYPDGYVEEGLFDNDELKGKKSKRFKEIFEENIAALQDGEDVDGENSANSGDSADSLVIMELDKDIRSLPYQRPIIVPDQSAAAAAAT